jgi:hypothetical protein
LAGFLVATSSARAGALYTYTWTWTANPSDVTFTTDPMPGVTTTTAISAADLASYDLSGSYWNGTTLDYVVLDFPPVGEMEIFSTGYQELFSGPGLTAADYTTPGVYIYDNGYETLSVGAGVPEPSIWAMTLLGLGCLGAVLRSRRQMATVASGAIG